MGKTNTSRNMPFDSATPLAYGFTAMLFLAGCPGFETQCGAMFC